jgi:hypothetical protein
VVGGREKERERQGQVRCEPPRLTDLRSDGHSRPVLSCGEPAISLMQSALFSSVTAVIGWRGGGVGGGLIEGGRGEWTWVLGMGVVCMVCMDASAGMSNDETTQKRKEKREIRKGEMGNKRKKKRKLDTARDKDRCDASRHH